MILKGILIVKLYLVRSLLAVISASSQDRVLVISSSFFMMTSDLSDEGLVLFFLCCKERLVPLVFGKTDSAEFSNI